MYYYVFGGESGRSASRDKGGGGRKIKKSETMMRMGEVERGEGRFRAASGFPTCHKHG